MAPVKTVRPNLTHQIPQAMNLLSRTVKRLSSYNVRWPDLVNAMKIAYDSMKK